MTEPATTTPAETAKPAKKKGKPGSGWFGAAIIVFICGLFILIVSSNTTDAYGYHTGPTIQTILITFVVPVVLLAIGFGRRVLFLLEARAK